VTKKINGELACRRWGGQMDVLEKIKGDQKKKVKGGRKGGIVKTAKTAYKGAQRRTNNLKWSKEEK